MKANKLKKAIFPIAGVALSVVGAGVAQAAELTFSDSFEPMVTELGGFGPPVDFGEVLTVEKFDPSLGTLTDVMVRFTYNIDSSGTLTNNSGGDQSNISVTVSTDFFLNGATDPDPASDAIVSLLTNSGPIPDPLSNPVDGASVTGFQFYPSILDGATVDFDPPADEDMIGFLSIPAGSVAAFIASGGDTDLSIEAATQSGLNITGGGGNFDADLTTLAGATLEVMYTFDEVTEPPEPPQPPTDTDVPEPASLLGLLAVGGVGFVTRRRKS